LQRLGEFLQERPARFLGKTHDEQSRRRSAGSAAVHVTSHFPGPSTAPQRSGSGRAVNTTAPTTYSPTRHGATHCTVRVLTSVRGLARAAQKRVPACVP
jgi:hypothetical protein